MNKIKRIKAWAVWDEELNEPLVCLCHNGNTMMAIGFTKKDAQSFEADPQWKIIPVLITSLKR